MKSIVGLILLLFSLVACSGGGVSTLADTPIPMGSSTGEQLYHFKGCSTCHGSRQGGSVIAPKLNGFTANQVKRQVRAPVGAMPVFGPSVISNEELNLIALFVASLSHDDTFTVMDDQSQTVFQEHWMILFSLADGFSEEAIRHADNIIKLVSGPHQAELKQASALIESGNTHEAVHLVENMVAGVEVENLNFLGIRVKMSHRATLVGDINTAVHFLSHASESLNADNELLYSRIQEIVNSLDSGNLEQASLGLEEIIAD